MKKKNTSFEALIYWSHNWCLMSCTSADFDIITELISHCLESSWIILYFMNPLILHCRLQPFEMPDLFPSATHYPINNPRSFRKLIATHLFQRVLCVLRNRVRPSAFVNGPSSSRAEEHIDVDGFRLLSAYWEWGQEMSAFFFFQGE